MTVPLVTRLQNALLPLQTTTSGGGGINWELILIVTIAGAILVTFGWLVLAKGGGGGAD